MWLNIIRQHKHSTSYRRLLTTGGYAAFQLDVEMILGQETGLSGNLNSP